MFGESKEEARELPGEKNNVQKGVRWKMLGLRWLLALLAPLMAAAEGNNEWVEVSPSGTSPGSREYASAVWGTQRMYFFGGKDGDTYLNDFHYYDAQANAWVSPTPSSGTAPAARYGHTCVWDATGGKVWIFGGLSSSSIRLSDLNYYDEAANAWVSVTPISGSASGRLFHAAAWDDAGASMWIFGGYDDSGVVNDLLYYDSAASTWNSVSPISGSAPSVRYNHVAVWDENGSKMWIYAGWGDGSYKSDLHYYDKGANGWVSVTPLSGTVPDARRGPSMVWDAAGSRIWIFGGQSSSGGDFDDVHYYDTQASSWNAVSPSGTTPASRNYHMAALDADNERMYIHAGSTGQTRMGDELYYYDFQEPATTTSTSSRTTSSTTSSSTSTSSTSTTATITSSSTSSTTTSSTMTSSTMTSSTTTSSTTSSSTTSSTTSSASTSTSTSSSSTTTNTASTTSTSSSVTTSTTSTSTTTTTTSSATRSTVSTLTSTSSSSISSTTTTSSSSRTTTTTTGSATSNSASSTSSTSSASSSATTTGTTTITASTSSNSMTSTSKTASTTTTSSQTISATHSTTSTKTTTAFPERLSPNELQELETKRKEAATQAVAAVEEAEAEAVAAAVEAIDALLNGNSNGNSNATTTPGVLGEVAIETPAGPVKVAALSLDALAEADGPATISAGEDTGAALEITAGVLGEVARASGSDTVLLSLAALSEDASAALKSDNVLAPGGRRLAKSASILQSVPISINFRTTNGTKIKVSGLVEPMQMVLRVANPNATCAFWDEDRAEWSSDGVETLPHQEPGTIVCSTTHLSIFGGVIDVVLRNVVLALECSTVSSLVNIDALRKIVDPEWLKRPAALVMIGTLAVSVIALAVAWRADRRLLESFPAADREELLMRVKVLEGQTKESDEMEGSKGGEGAEAEEGEPTEQKDPSEEEAGGAERGGRDEEKKETAAGGDFELPSIFRTLRGLVEGLLDAVNQMTGGEGFIEEVKEVVSNAESGSINRAIGLVQAQRSGADQTTIQALQRRAEMVDDDNGRQTQSFGTRDASSKAAAECERREADLESPGELGPSDEVSAGGGARRSRPSVHTIDVQSANSQQEGSQNRSVESRQQDHDHQDHQDFQVQRNARRSMRQTVVSMIGEVVAAAQRSSVWVLHGHVARSGSGAAQRYLNSNVFCRTLILFPAAHTWLKVGQISISVSYSARVVLIYLKLQSAAMLNAMFFAASSLPREADPGCKPDAGSAESWIQKITVGIVSAMIGDFIIFLLFMIVRKSAYEEVEWTEEKKDRRRRKWKRREYIFWIFSVVYGSVLVLYTDTFLSNVSDADASKWLESTAISLLQDLMLKPVLLAVILAVMSTIVLNCRPKIKRQISQRWTQRGDAEDRRDTISSDDAQDRRDSLTSDHKQEASERLRLHAALGIHLGQRQEKLDEERPAKRSERTEFAAILPGAVHD